MCDSDPAGSRPRSRSSALAPTARARAAGGSPSVRGKLASTHARTRGSAARVGAEQRVHRRLVLRAELGGAVVAVPAAAGHRRVVGDVARGLLEVGRRPRALQHLGQHVRDPLARDVGAAELRHRVVPVADEDPLEEPRRPLALAAVPRPAARRHRVGELVEEEPPQRAGVARIAGEQRALHRLGQVDEREHRAVEVGDVRREPLALGGREVVGRVAHGRMRLPPAPAAAVRPRGTRRAAQAELPLRPAGRHRRNARIARERCLAGAPGPVRDGAVPPGRASIVDFPAPGPSNSTLNARHRYASRRGRRLPHRPPRPVTAGALGTPARDPAPAPPQPPAPLREAPGSPRAAAARSRRSRPPRR